MDNVDNTLLATPESVWAFLRELAERQAQTDRQMAETSRKMAETDRQITETTRQIAQTDRQIEQTGIQMAETDRKMAETDRLITRLEKQIGGVTNNHGSFAEEYFFNSLEQGKKIFLDEKFDKLLKSVIVKDDNNRIIGEFDMILVNGKSVAIIEVKFRAREKHVDMVMKKVKPFRAKFPEYQNHQVYLGLASMVFDEDIEEKCKENGIAVIKQVGDMVVIHDENLKAF
jgi:hypothetical protein